LDEEAFRFKSSQCRSAREEYEAALREVPMYPEALYALGTVYGEKHEPDFALEQFEKVLKVSARHAGAYFWRAVIRADRMQFEEALADCDKAIRFYDEQVAVLEKSIAAAEKRGLSRRAGAELRKKEQVEETRDRARALRAEITKPR
jgi:tetratricopeptide (TPR) repeat protein